MSTLTSSATLPIGEGTTVSDTIAVSVVAPPGAGAGNGRLVHPSLGTFDYERPPDDWSNMNGDAIIAPIWSSTKTLLGAANTLFVGDLRDVIVEERWTQSIACSINHLNMLLSMWVNPPDPSVAFIQWYPSYINSLGFNVVILGLTAGNKDITMTPLVHAGWQRGPIVLKMRITGRV